MSPSRGGGAMTELGLHLRARMRSASDIDFVVKLGTSSSAVNQLLDFSYFQSYQPPPIFMLRQITLATIVCQITLYAAFENELSA